MAMEIPCDGDGPGSMPPVGTLTPSPPLPIPLGWSNSADDAHLSSFLDAGDVVRLYPHKNIHQNGRCIALDENAVN
jgi:hypothetical protein